MSDLAKLDARVEANVDGLRIAERRGWSASDDELEQGGAGEFFVAGVLALESGGPGRLDRVVELAFTRTAETATLPYLPAEDPWRGLVSALAWVEREHAAGEITRLLNMPRPRIRWLGVAACGARRITHQLGLEAALIDAEPPVRARAARAMGELGRADLQAELDRLLTDSDEDCRFWATWSAARLGSREGINGLAEFSRSPGPRCDMALDILLRRLETDQANRFLRPLARDPQQRRTVIRATGTIGDALYLPWLVRQAADPAVAQTAGDAFATITGADLDDLSREPPLDFEQGPNDNPEDETVVSDEDDGLAWLDPEKLSHWWRSNESRFVPGTCYFLGTPKRSVNWITVLSQAVQRRRYSAALELALRSPGHVMFEVRDRGDLQQRVLRRASGSA